MPGKILQGEVVSDKMDKTVVVKTVLTKRHQKYHKLYRIFKNYKAHDPQNEYHVGDIVEIQENRPISKTKRWAVVRKIK